MAIFTCKKKEKEKSMAYNNGDQVVEVWKHNLKTELHKISQLRQAQQYIFFDTEFPGFLLSTARDVSEEDCYRAVKFNVDRLKVIQFGLTLSNGKEYFSWQFNLKEFDQKVDSHSEASLEFLKESGIDFDKNLIDGVDACELSAFLLDRLIRGCTGTKWVTFHGVYDVAYFVKLICQKPLPSTLSEFLQTVWSLFGVVYDVKYMARECSAVFAEVGLVRLAKMLGVAWVGKLHQAGHDSLLMAMTFWELKKKYIDLDEGRYAGLMYGVERHGLVQLNNVFGQHHPINAPAEEEEDILVPYCGVARVEKVYGTFKPGYYAVSPPACYYHGYQPFHANFGPATLIQVPVSVPFYG